MTDELEAKEVYDLLNQNYVEDDDNMFRFDYSPAFLEWALTPPGNQKDFVVGIRVTPSAAALAKGKGRGKLVGFITGVPVQMRVYEQIMPMVEINFLCVLKKLRSKRLAPVLIKEITRRVNLTGVSAHIESTMSLLMPCYPILTRTCLLSPLGVASRLHRRRPPPQARGKLQVPSPPYPTQEARGDWLHAPGPAHDHGPHRPALPAP